MFFFAGAGLAQPVWDKLDPSPAGMRRTHQDAHRPRDDRGLAVRDLRQRARGQVGPHRPARTRVELKLVPTGDKEEVRYRGPNVTPGYWRAPSRRPSVRREGFYCSGDAEADGPGAPRARVHVRRPHRRGFQALDRHLRLGRAAARKIIAAGDPWCRTSSSPESTATRSASSVPAPRRLPGWPAAGDASAHPLGDETCVIPAALVDSLHASGRRLDAGRARSSSPSRHRSTAARSPTRARSTSAPC